MKWFQAAGGLALQLIEWLRVRTVSHKEVEASLNSIVAEKEHCINEIVRLWRGPPSYESGGFILFIPCAYRIAALPFISR